jgi:hypothetical protein
MHCSKNVTHRTHFLIQMSPPIEAKFKYNLGVELMQKVKGREYHANVLQDASQTICWYPKELEICASNVEPNKGGLLFFSMTKATSRKC